MSAAEPEITDALVASHGLKPDEYARFVALLGRAPTFTELGIVSAMWNEHCSYKSSQIHLRKLPTTAPQVIQGPGENAGRHRHRRRPRLRLQDGEPQPSLVHRALSGRGDRGRRHFARRLHDGRAAGRLPQFPALRRARSSQHPASRGGRRRGDRRLRQFVRRADGRRFGRLSQALRRQHSGQCDGGRRRARRPDFHRHSDRRRKSDRLSRLEDRPRRHSRRDHGLGGLRGGCARKSARPCRSAIRSPKSCCSKPASN